ncbi:endonuclease [Tenacibaculum tangerinum]|uniref:Endonuclease n=1 Tax=Tenacibaculum tangerinum TaxID=3038772 RepID=A0ABY8L416_9FLAO|nr:endonuclease [Tenacibaculum tangerinum]WGH76009.1 endonuclease [Tenacibaculum tangerinum]
MKQKLLLILLIASLSVFSQVPSYYNDVNLNLSGTSLKNELATKIISTHTTNLSYTPGVWDALKQTDLDPTDPSKVLLIYGYSDTDGNYVTDRTRDKNANGGTAGTQWNREHVYPKSLGNPNLGTSGPGADAHHIRPADISFNSQRSSKKFANGSGNAGDVAGGWYPGDEWKGDVARMMMYMYLRYGNQCLPSNVGTGATMSSDSNMLALFIQWNVEDPVSDFEKQRNPILENLQGNRNPFIDNPAFATQIWGGAQAEDLFGNGGGGSSDTQAPTSPTSLTASNVTETSVSLTWNAATDNVGVTSYDVYNGAAKIATISTISYTVTGLTAATNYTFSVKAKDAAGNESNASNTVSVTTNTGSDGGTGTATDVFISEYVEGSSNNKAIEIANFTGTTVNLSGYSLKKAANGGGWTNTLTLSGQLATGNVYVIANSSASSTILNKADRTDTGVLSFNGNDAVGLFKGTTLIDLIGNPNSSATFAQDVTLQRKSSVASPNSSYTTAEWDVLSTDTFSGLGSHSVDGSSATPDTEAPTSPSNLTVANVTQTSADLSWNAATDNIAVTAYEVYQANTKIATVTSTSYSVTGLTAATNYTFSVKATDEAGNTSNASNIIGVTTKSVTATNTILSESYFEGSLDNWIDGGGDCALYSGSYSYEGNYSVRLRDNSGTASSMTSPSYDLTAYDSVEVTFYFYANSMENGEDFWVRYYNGSTWQTVATYASGSYFQNNYFYTATVVLQKANYNFAANSKFRFQCDASANADQVYIDQVTITGKTGTSAKGSELNTINRLQYMDATIQLFEEDFKMYPNPATGNVLHIQLQNEEKSKVAYTISSVIGQVIAKGELTEDYIEIGNLQPGFYLLEISNGEEKMVQKFVKK